MYQMLPILSISICEACNSTSSLESWLQSPQLNGPNGLHIDNNKNKLIVVSLEPLSKPVGGIEIIDLKIR